MKLTAKQERYVQEIIKGKSQRQAYRIAYPSSRKWKDSTVDSKASNLLKNDKVKARYNELNGKAIDKAIITRKRIIEEITDVALDDISNYLDFRTEKVVVAYDEDGKPIIDYRTIVDLKDSRTINTKNVSEVSIGTNGSFKFKMYCKDKALYKLAEMFGIDELNQAKQQLAEDRFEHEKDKDSKKYW